MDNLVRNFALELTRPRRYNYSQEPLQQFLLVHPEVHCSHFRIPNSRGHLLETLLFRTHPTDTCILYAHGLGSNKLEALSIAKCYLRQGYDVCSFDFGGSGRSEGEMTTYGLLEKDDILTVLKHLEATEKYGRVVLWGRSMGAVAAVMALDQEENSKVECLVLDSPFCSFEKVAVEIAAKKSFIPQFMLSVLVEPLKQYFCEHQEACNPFSIDLSSALRRLDTPLLLIYSPNDSVVSSQHSKDIVTLCRRNPTELVIQEDHNMQRSKSTLTRILRFMQEAAREAERKVVMARNRNRGISVASKEGRESIRSVSKVRLTQQPSAIKLSARQPSKSKVSERQIHTIGSTLNQSVQYERKRAQTETSTKKKIHAISSLFMDSKLPEHRLGGMGNKENMKPTLNLLRKNRFR